MTLILSIQRRESLWMLADRRLSHANRLPQDDAVKIAVLECHDGLALVGYAGVGKTRVGTQPSSWISNALRGHNVSIQESLNILADAAKRELPPHLGLSGQHSLLASAFVAGRPCGFTIDLKATAKGTAAGYNRHIMGEHLIGRELARPAMAIGSGARYLQRDRSWLRPLLSLIKACEEGRLPTAVVGKRFAKICYRVHEQVPKSVGPSCLVVMRYTAKSHWGQGGDEFFYMESERQLHQASVPKIDRGMDLIAMMKVIFRNSDSLVRASELGRWDETDEEARLREESIVAEWGRLPSKPDDKLR